MPDPLTKPESTSPKASGDLFFLFFVPSLCIAPICIGLLGVMATAIHGWDGGVSIAMTLGVPLAVGGVVGFASRRPGYAIVALLVLAAIGSLVLALVVMDLAGIFCGAIFTVVALPPALLAAWGGHLLRRRWFRDATPRTVTKVDGALVLLPLALHLAESLVGPSRTPETLTWTAELALPIDVAWRQTILATPDEIADEGWFRLRLPRPVQASGRATAVGDEKTIRFAKGRMTVRVDAVAPGRELRLAVIEQDHLEDRALRMQEVVVRCEPIDAQHTRATISLRFVPLMTPRWYWRPFERATTDALFAAVFSAWERAGAAGVAATPGR